VAIVALIVRRWARVGDYFVVVKLQPYVGSHQ
jgi:hypothetical protein